MLSNENLENQVFVAVWSKYITQVANAEPNRASADDATGDLYWDKRQNIFFLSVTCCLHYPPLLATVVFGA